MSLTKDMIRQAIEEETGRAFKVGDLAYKEGSKGIIVIPPERGYRPDVRIFWITGPLTGTISWEYVNHLGAPKTLVNGGSR